MNRHRYRGLLPVLTAIVFGVVAYFAGMSDASAVPSFARKYKTSCLTCHTIYPVLNPFGEAFRRNGYRMPSKDRSMDSDSIKDEQLALGQEEYRKLFPEAVWPDQIPQAVPLSMMVNGAVAYNFPQSDAHAANGNAFTWNGVTTEFHLFGAGAFTDALTYFAQLTITDAGVDLETAYLLLNDIVGPRHLFNLWVGRLMNPSLTSFGLHSSYMSDSGIPATSLSALYNPTGTFSLGQGHTDGVEANGIVAHRFIWSLGWIASGATAGLSLPTSEDVYGHVGFKLGGMSLDGEGSSGAQVADPMRPWAETSLTVDAFAYHGLSLVDNGTGVTAGTPIRQDDQINAAGGSIRLHLASLALTSGVQYEAHASPYSGSAATPADAVNPAIPGSPDLRAGKALSQYNELSYVVYPWLVPGVRVEYTKLTMRPDTDGVDGANLLRVTPGVAFLIRPNIKLVVTGSFERATGLPPAGSWGAAGGSIVAPPGAASKIEAEQLNAVVAWAF